ncbi:MAG: DNA primase [Armatimonadetes bacterium]|nr:DNA primase [Candidatus Hippobium faecium]
MDTDVISEIKKRINIVDFISGYVTLRKRGKSYIGLCPFHKEKTGSFNVNADKGFYKCFGCGESGDIFTFLQKYENIEFYEALKILAEKAGVDLPVSSGEKIRKSEKDEIFIANANAVSFFRNSLKSSAAALSYLSRRGISPEIAERFSLGYSPEGWNGLLNYFTEKKIRWEVGEKAGLLKKSEKKQNSYYDVFRDRVMFPIFNSMGKPIGFGGRNMGKEEPKYLNTPETLVFNKGKEFYGLNLAKEAITHSDQAIIVEGYMDVIACHGSGIENAIAVLGTALTDEHIEKITRYTKNIVLCFDADNAGIKAALRSGDLFVKKGISPKIATTPKGEDPDSYLQNHSKADFLKLTDNAVGLFEFEIKICLDRYNLEDKEQQAEALTQACKIIGKEPNAIKREVLIGSLVAHYPNLSANNIEETLRNEVNRNLVSYHSSEKNDRKSVRKFDRYEMAERIIISGMCNGVYDLVIFDSLDENDFSQGINRLLFCEIRNKVFEGKAPVYSELEMTARENNLGEAFYSLIGMDENLFRHPLEKLVDLLLVRKNKKNIQRRKELQNRLDSGVLTNEEQAELMKLIIGK